MLTKEIGFAIVVGVALFIYYISNEKNHTVSFYIACGVTLVFGGILAAIGLSQNFPLSEIFGDSPEGNAGKLFYFFWCSVTVTTCYFVVWFIGQFNKPVRYKRQ